MSDAPEPDPAPPDSADRTSGRPADDATPPMLPSRTAFLLAFAGVVVAGILGGIIGYGIADVSSQSDAAHLAGTFVGSVIGAAGVGIVAVLVLRAMSEWNRKQA
ncbi:MAG: hypothetical protein ACHQDE_06185 [Acidimicrobiia bacterium]